ncbi:Hypothetical protein R9X50_00249600 [Acrodontium crateriforme]|uniref:Bacteriophage T5 Orf172 DNA-binding domain-containing protein n=1 Tax=Acrodontium crateriforme TaxID=150365 RepID=A0AAQ3M3Z3_9PEZI|nr:Hypothetical protein R9X50_00249600 [Acrodontium crateriforme]
MQGENDDPSRKPLPMDSRQCIRRIALSKEKPEETRRCKSNTSKADFDQASQLKSELGDREKRVQPHKIERLICLRVCNIHRPKENDEPLRKKLAEEYDVFTPSDSPQCWEQRDMTFEPYPNNPQAITKLIRRQINPTQDKQGSIYIFDWPQAPGFIKIGYAKNESGAERVSKWTKCHSEAKEILDLPFSFPERMEQLIHAELSTKRHQFKVPCKFCKRRHHEWFQVSPEEGIRVVETWHSVTALYGDDRYLSKDWVAVLDENHILTATDLLAAWENTKASHHSEDQKKQTIWSEQELTKNFEDVMAINA